MKLSEQITLIIHFCKTVVKVVKVNSQRSVCYSHLNY